jgi:aminoglycoside phosphotransferase (APT) family kinase protein
LYAQLHAVAPESVLTPLGLDVEHGWMLLPDGGTLLGQAADGEALANALTRVMPKYAELQLALMPQALGLISLGVTDMTPARMPTRFEQALEAVRSFLQREGSTSEWDEFRKVAALGPRYAEWCQELATAPGAPSLDHNDLHPWNIFATLPTPEADARFFDWGDSVIAHPFASLLVLLQNLRQSLEAPADDLRILRVRDAYLEAFGALASHRELVETADLACRVAKIARVLTWQRAIGNKPASDYASIPFGKLVELLQDR